MLRDIEGRVLSDVVFANDLATCFLQVQTCKGSIRAMGFEHHPMFADLFRLGEQKRGAAGDSLDVAAPRTTCIDKIWA